MDSNSKVNLRPFTNDDLAKVAVWSEDTELASFLGLKLPGEEVDYYQRCQMLLCKRNSRLYALETVNHEFIGEAELNQITWRRKEAELHICIGDRNYWDQGYGTEAVLALLEIAFHELGLNWIYLRVYRHNQRAIRCYEKCGFHKEAILKNRFQLGKAYDIILMKVNVAEFSQMQTVS
ncbi:MAG: GNAT family N-acetyltransferase [bacterium]|jgi:RimJ/RimL family protein N-acetyltransferase